MSCHLVLTTGGTGPARRDVTPDATLAVADREMPGFGEQMRQISLHFVPTISPANVTGDETVISLFGGTNVLGNLLPCTLIPVSVR